MSERTSRIRFLRQQNRWLRADIKEGKIHAGISKIRNWIKENTQELNNLLKS